MFDFVGSQLQDMGFFGDPTKRDLTGIVHKMSLINCLRRDPTVHEHRAQSGRAAVNYSQSATINDRPSTVAVTPRLLATATNWRYDLYAYYSFLLAESS
jgi:hypothetical protein